MFVHYVLYTIWFVLGPVAAVKRCHLSDCAIRAESNCSYNDLTGIELPLHYAPVKRNGPMIKNPDHLFNLLVNPQEKDCVSLDISTSAGSELELFVSVQCGMDFSSTFSVAYATKFRTQIEPQVFTAPLSCIKPDVTTDNLIKKCGIFAHERLRLTFLDNGAQLLIEEMAARAPKGASVMLKKAKYGSPKGCRCLRFVNYWNKYRRCATDAEKELSKTHFAGQWTPIHRKKKQ